VCISQDGIVIVENSTVSQCPTKPCTTPNTLYVQSTVNYLL